jgi:translation initiation factor 4G
MKFLGELYLRDVVKLAIMMYCLDELLKDEEHEESLECFAHLMTTMGEKLDRHATQNNKNFNWQQVVDLRNSTKISNRIKFLLQDLLDLRDRGWVKRRKEDTAKTIADLHKEVAKEEQEAKNASRRASTTSLRRSTSLAAAPQVDDDGFVSITGSRGGGGSFKKVNSKANLGPPPSPSIPKPVSTSLRRAVSQPGMSKDVLESPFDRKKIASQLGAAPPMPIMEKSHSDIASPDHCAKKIQSILKEYYAGGDTDDAVLSVEELVQPDVDGAVERGAKVIEGATILAMEGIPGDVRKMLSVMTRSVQEGKIPSASIIQGWQDPLEFLPDIIIDAPLAGKHLALIIAECLKLNALELTFLVDESPEYFRTSGKAALLAIQVLMVRGGDPSDEELEVVQALMTDDDKKAFDSAKLMWEASKK